jgi:hypothetical protein
MEILQNLSKNQLIDLVKKHPKYKHRSSSSLSNKTQLIELVISLDIPFTIDIENLNSYSFKLLKLEAKKNSNYVPSKHAKNKPELIEFLKKEMNQKQNDRIVQFQDKLLDCLLREDDLTFTKQELEDKIEKWF